MPNQAKDYIAKERKHEADLFKQLEKRPVEDLLGIIHPPGVGGSRIQGQRHWTLQIPLIAWRRPDKPVQTEELRVIRKTTERTITQYQKTIKAWDIVRFKARIAEDNLTAKPQALLVKFLGKDRDAELRGLVKQLKKPVTFEDRVLGTLTLDRAFNTFEATMMWNTKEITLMFEEEGPAKPKASISHAKAIQKAQKTWSQRIFKCAATELLKLKNETWLDEDQDPITENQFADAMVLESISFHPDGTFSFWFDDGDLFWGHSIVVRGSVQEGPTDATIEG